MGMKSATKAIIAGKVQTATFNKKNILDEFKSYAEKVKKNMAVDNVGQADRATD